MRVRTMILCLAIAGTGCVSNSPEDVDTESNSGTDTNSDTTSDTDGDTDSDTDSHTDSDTDSHTGAGPAPVNLGTASTFVMLAESAVSTVGASAITGDVGLSPAAQTYITGFSEILHSSEEYATSSLVTGKIYASDMSVPTPANLTAAVNDMHTAYTDAAGRSNPDFTELSGGDISGLTLVPGLYKWGTGVSINTDVTLLGGPDDIWIFQVSQGLTQASASRVILSGGAVPENIFWQFFGDVSIGTEAHFEGVILAQTAIALNTGATINGRLMAQTAITLDASTVTSPAR